MTCLRSPRVAELRFDPSHLGSFLPSSRLSQLVPFPLGRVTPGHLTLGRDSGTVGRGAPGAGACGRWQALWPPPLFLLCRVCGPAVFYPSREGAPGPWRWRAQGGGWMWVACFPFLGCWFRFCDCVFSPLGAGARGPGVSLRGMAPEGASGAEPVRAGSVPILHALARPCSLTSLALGPCL